MLLALSLHTWLLYSYILASLLRFNLSLYMEILKLVSVFSKMQCLKANTCQWSWWWCWWLWRWCCDSSVQWVQGCWDLIWTVLQNEWRAIGVQQSRGWVHYAIHRPEPHIMLFRRPLNYHHQQQHQAQNVLAKWIAFSITKDLVLQMSVSVLEITLSNYVFMDSLC